MQSLSFADFLKEQGNITKPLLHFLNLMYDIWCVFEMAHARQAFFSCCFAVER